MQIRKVSTTLAQGLYSLITGSTSRLFFQALWIKVFLSKSRPPKNSHDGAPIPSLTEFEPSRIHHGQALPQIIFQTWKSKLQIPENYAYWNATFRRLNPQYQCVLWDDEDNRNFITGHFPWFLSYYETYPREIFRADIIRLFFLFTYGGLYADMDTECLRPIGAGFDSADVVLGRMGRNEEFAHSIPNAMMASKPHQLFWLLAIAMAIERLQQCNDIEKMNAKGPEFFTGPILIKDAVAFYTSSTEATVRKRAAGASVPLSLVEQAEPGVVSLLEKQLWYPINWSNPVHAFFRREMLAKKYIPGPRMVRFLFPRSHLVTYWTHSW